jgi:hypothetical protein
VVDGDGEYVASFPRLRWEVAHAWCHMRAAEPRTVLPVRLEDLVRRESWEFPGTGRCVHLVWQLRSRAESPTRCNTGAS